MDIHGGQVWSVVIPNQNIMLKGKTFMFSFLMIHLLEHGFTGSKYRYLLHIVFFYFLVQQPPVGRGLLIHKVSRSHATMHHSRQDSSGRVISSLLTPLPDSTQHPQQTNIHALVGFEPAISADERLQTYALDHAATGTGLHIVYVVLLMI